VINDMQSILFQNNQGEMQIRLADADQYDLPAWPGQWSQDEIDVVASSPLAKRVLPETGLSYKQLANMLRKGRYAVQQPAKGYGVGLDREKIVVCNPYTENFFRLKISKNWRLEDGVPQIGILTLGPLVLWDFDYLLSHRIDAAKKAMTPSRFNTWYQGIERFKNDPNVPLKVRMHRRDAAIVDVLLYDGRSLEIGVLPLEITSLPSSEMASTPLFWEWVDRRIRETREYQSRRYGVDIHDDFALENIDSIRVHTRREPVEHDFILWRRA